MALVLAVPSLWGLAYFGVGPGTTDKAAGLVLGICLAFTAFSGYVTLSTLRSKIVLYADWIEIHELTRIHVVKRGDIAGWRLHAALILERSDPMAKTISTAWIYKADDELNEWLAGLTNLDDSEVESAIDAIAEDAGLGTTEDERFDELARTARLARALNILGGALSAWAFFFPEPYNLTMALLIVAPWLATLVAWRSGGLIHWDSRPNDVKPNLVFLTWFPALILALRALLDYETVGWQAQTMAALLFGCLLFAAQLAAYPDIRAKRLAAILAFVLVVPSYGYGSALHINRLTNSSDIEQTRYVLLQKYSQEEGAGASDSTCSRVLCGCVLRRLRHRSDLPHSGQMAVLLFLTAPPESTNRSTTAPWSRGIVP